MLSHYIRQNLFNPTCLSCGSFFVKSHLFCYHCFQTKIEPRFDFKEIKQEGCENAFSLFSWAPYESDVLSEMVYRMKKGRCSLALNYYTGQALRALRYEKPDCIFDAMIPIPGSSQASSHALLMARQSSHLLQIPVLDILKKAPGASQGFEQKEKTKRERAQARFYLHEQITESELAARLENKRVLVVDDIITTGSSFIQAKKLLKVTESVTLLTLFHRLEKSNTTLVS